MLNHTERYCDRSWVLAGVSEVECGRSRDVRGLAGLDIELARGDVAHVVLDDTYTHERPRLAHRPMVQTSSVMIFQISLPIVIRSSGVDFKPLLKRSSTFFTLSGGSIPGAACGIPVTEGWAGA